MVYEVDRRVTADQIKNGEGASIAARLGILSTPNKHGLVCLCDKGAVCTCKLAKPIITRDAARPGIGDPRLIVACMALRHLDERLSRFESIRHGAHQPSMAQGQAPQDIINAAAQKAAQFQAENYARKVDEGILESHQKRAEQAYRQAHGDPSEPRHAQPQQRPDIDSEAHRHGAPLDPSSGDNRQATTKHPLGKSRMTGDSEFMTPEQARQLFKQRDTEQAARRKAFEREAAANRTFNQNQHAMVRSIQEINDRYNLDRYGSR
jgi:hypothetical protein